MPRTRVAPSVAAILLALGYTPANVAGDTFTGNVTVSRSAAAATVTVRSDGNSGRGTFEAYNNSGASDCLISMKKAAGSLAAPALVANGDFLGRIFWSAHTGSAFANVGALVAYVDDAGVSATSIGTRLMVQLAAPTTIGVAEFLGMDWTRGLTLGGDTNVFLSAARHFVLRAYTVGTLPSAATANQIIAVTDGTSNKRLAISDGAAWRFPDGNVVS